MVPVKAQAYNDINSMLAVISEKSYSRGAGVRSRNPPRTAVHEVTKYK